VRGYLSGLDPQGACSRYLPGEQRPASEGAALRRLIALLAKIADTAAARPHGTQEAEQAQRAARTLRARQHDAELRRQALLGKDRLARLRRQAAGLANAALPSPPPPPGPEASLPARFDSLDAFREHYIETRLGGLDPDLGEDEWEALFVEALEDMEGALNASSKSTPLPQPVMSLVDEVAVPTSRIAEADQALAALETCRWVVTREPKASDLVDTWFTGNTVKRLKAADVPTLYALVELINQRGRRWWKAVRGLGPERGQRVTEWLQSVGGQAGLNLRTDLAIPVPVARMMQRATQAAAPGWDRLAAVHLEPLALVAAQQSLDGSVSVFRLSGANLLGAKTDLEAIAGVLEKYADRAHTLAVYSREICRFAFWCYFELRKPISSVTMPDARRFKEFLDNIPADWINPIPTLRGTHGWRPFRGQLDDATKRKALTSVHVVLHQLHSAGYLVGNAMAGVLKRSSIAKPTMDVSRSLSEEQWQFILGQLDALPSSRRLAAIQRSNRSPPAKARLTQAEHAKARRLKALMRLLQATGMRIHECENARLSHITKVPLDKDVFYTLDVIGKGNKHRLVYVPTPVLQLVLEHLQDRNQDIFNDDAQTASGRARMPLISVLQSPVASWQEAAPGESPALLATPLAHPSGALGASSMHRILKRFLVGCVLQAKGDGLDTDAFERASAHWLRHTFGTMLADNGTDLRTIQSALGHSNINTSAAYSRKSRDKLLRELHAGMPESMRT